ncbi:hypothetical protein ACIBG8_14530 [Nonomuraea sp. NPDC050556]|uniref:hypothetical protein n=1 Tax=Nonomuraea sp. NPDC050556 TaxID=3364369 RepID=UPI00378D9819
MRAGRSPEELAEEFEPSAQSIRAWVRQADLDDGHRLDGPTSTERDELARLRRENKVLREVSLLARVLGVSRQGYYAWAAQSTLIVYARVSDRRSR